VDKNGLGEQKKMQTEPAHILVIDDETRICEGCRASLGDLGHRVTICITGILGIKTLARQAFIERLCFPYNKCAKDMTCANRNALTRKPRSRAIAWCFQRIVSAPFN
jgi:CheY-like chemotaxis protein